MANGDATFTQLGQSLDNRIGSLDGRMQGLENKVGSLENKLGEVDRKLGILDERVMSQTTILIQKMEGLESRIVNKLWGIVAVSLAIAVAVLGYIISTNDRPAILYSVPYHMESSVQPVVPKSPVIQPVAPKNQRKP